MPFSDAAWAGIGSVYDAILAHPFVTELAEGTLAEERFRFYMIQDALYLVEFSRALALTAARAHNTNSLVKFAAAAHEAIVVERTLHRRGECGTRGRISIRQKLRGACLD